MKKSIDYLINCIKNPKETARKALLTTTLLLSLVTSSCGYKVYIQGVEIDNNRKYTVPAIIGTAAFIAGGFALQRYEIQRADNKRKEDRRDYYRNLPTSSGGRIEYGSGEE